MWEEVTIANYSMLSMSQVCVNGAKIVEYHPESAATCSFDLRSYSDNDLVSVGYCWDGVVIAHYFWK